MDGLGAEKSHRWAGERIWGEARVASEWSSESWLRAQVRCWIPKVGALAEGGWSDLESRHVPDAVAGRAKRRTGRVAATSPSESGTFAVRHEPPGVTVVGARRRCFGNVPQSRWLRWTCGV